MLVSAAITLARALTNQDGANNDQVDDTTQLLPLVQLEVELLRAQIAELAPHLFEATTAEFPITTSAPTVAKPADFKRVIRVERKSAFTHARFLPVEPSDGLRPDLDWLNWEERQSTLEFKPGEICTGTYRLVYETTVGTLALASAIPLPVGGFELIVVQRLAAHIRTRLKEDPSPHLTFALEAWNRARSALKRRQGAHPVPGLKRDRIR
ncbi:MAG TPA: hypothetical protein VFP80_03260 [Thermoanaerobaculia bacterium]|nr:hypothetical protein [Thermoanaerobaculia bacterium]